MKKLLIGTAALAFASVAGAASAEVSACLITKTETNPFFVKMKEGAEAAAAEHGVTLSSFSGKFDTDVEAQVAAIETCIANGAKGILITPAQSAAVVPAVTQARDAGLLVIALDTPLEPIDAADATFATDNFLAGELIGKWAAGTLGDEAANAKIAFLDLDPSQPSVGVLRDQGFMTGFGIDIKDPNRWGDEDDPRIVGHDTTQGSPEGGRKAMENLLAIDPDVNVVYAINEPAAAGGWEAMKAMGANPDDVIVVGVDGGCAGVRDVEAGVIDATSQQYPLKMAALGIEAIAKFAADGSLPENTPGKNFFDTGVALITDKPVEGVPSISVAEGLELCWG
ncbi:substrate-binding domain-containing protein [Ostreiculturibacter nitratireducens]|uniref:substrate-binding domain-containing protein n=1 Tax=Ostreiculturibacter nitratireducens TaxID=3075226 RepID=UPI0031B604B9